MSKVSLIAAPIPGVEFADAICYSGYRENQSPQHGVYPTYGEILEDLVMLQPNWRYLRLYDCSRHAELVLEVISKERLDFKVMLGANMRAEENNPNCPWGADFDEQTLHSNAAANSEEIDQMISLAEQYTNIVLAVSVGNEATVEWNDHMVSVERLVSFVQRIKKKIPQPVTFCENYVPWTNKLKPLVEVLDFISVHSYPVWEYQSIENAMNYTMQNIASVTDCYPGKPVVITEAGWTTNSNGRGIEPHNASQELQAEYCRQLVQWSREHQIITFLFEAFDEPWKGSPDPLEPEKHWGMYTVDRKPKLVAQSLFAA